MSTLNSMQTDANAESDSRTIEMREFLGMDVAVLTREGALEILENRLRNSIPVKLAFLNANLANNACDDAQLQNMLRGFFLLNDGSGINFASRLLYRKPFPDNLNGTDFTPYFLGECSVPLRIFLLGASPEVVIRAADIFGQRWPKHSIVGFQHGYFRHAEESQIIERIKSSKADIVLVAMGNGLQECWVDRLVPNVALSAWGVGALFDFLCGEVRRAPHWMRLLGIEWVYRLLQEPGRMWRRYLLGNPKFVARVLRGLMSRTFK